METIKAFFAEYGYSFLMMVVIGFVTAIITEITIKKALNWLEERLGDKGKKILAVARVVAIQLATWGQVILYTHILVKNMPLPGGKVFYVVWMFLVYIIQYLFSMYGIKGILEAIAKKAEKEKQPKVKKEKLDPVAGMQQLSDNLFTDGVNYYTKKGQKL